ncbi:lipase family alpha/beta hydrolase [Bacilliculturomica massiliensis]|uniref:lipase family alpha/beta hydrolase n=1 Tax=Bacilliculturomica massiliensis TaxID=1917867 RepID=UPI001FE93123|nr:alpha/beta fold hydrolase [Bacilliculturomica massiliensis]
MRVLWKALRIFLYLCLMNGALLRERTALSGAGFAALMAALFVFYAVSLVLPETEKGSGARLAVMKGGHTLILSAALCFVFEALLYAGVFGAAKIPVSWQTALINGVAALLLASFMMFVGFVRIIFTSTQLGIVTRLLLLLTWWIPVWNLFLFFRACGLVRREYHYEMARQELNQARKENEVCGTKYPILLVHGIFFRDWQLLNYWGRIPGELMRNGASVFYGEQQSAAPVSRSGEELAARIREILEAEGCEKVNIIAHSKGGLDSRYAISRLGMGQHVASLTTINTPHRGCVFAERLLKLFPEGLVRFIADKYNAVFRKLGDREPDFLGGVLDLTAGRCARFNEEVRDDDRVYYQSVTSKMKGMFSFGFPLIFTYPIVKFVEGENDGLVTPDSAKWGNFLGLVTGSGYRGVSHGDMVDLMRENIAGFDVKEFYVNIVSGLKERGL